MQFNAKARINGLIVGVCSIVLAVMLLCPMVAFADTAAEVQAEADAALASLNSMQEKLRQASYDYEVAMNDRDEAQAKADEAQVRIDETNEKIAGLQNRLGNRACSMYRSGTSSFIDLLLGATSFQEFSNNLTLLNILNQNDADLVQESKDLRAIVEAEQAEYEAQRAAADEAVSKAERIKQESETTVSSMQATYESLSEEAAALLAEEQAAQAAAQAAAAAAAAEATTDNGAANTGGGNEGAGNGGGNNGGNAGGAVGGWSPNGGGNVSYDPYVGGGILDRAQYWIGKAQYVYGACSPGQFDCSGFVAYCVTGSYSRLGGTGNIMSIYPQVSDPQPGDIVINASHCGIYVGGGQMIHASSPGIGVVCTSIDGWMNSSSYIYVRP
ncbi:coiled-coil domain-containing protein [Adlercreutzia sp. ZJ141]|uniref:coiled-coil domain-containing protein n=1 Tax=Adlercreutzia sp. ZJ141 TaxID=2709406 RepID=UPI0013EBAFF1|nr:NlpC/P60 family protein [Adlercreutzia sp. ZJ141]